MHLGKNKNIDKKLKLFEPLQLTVDENNAFETAGICPRKLGADWVRDHNHSTIVYSCVAHRYCNLQYQLRIWKGNERNDKDKKVRQ